MAHFVSKYAKYSLNLKPGNTKIINGQVVKENPITVHFLNGNYYTDGAQAKTLPWSGEKIAEEMRKAPAFNKEFWEPGKTPVSLADLLNEGIRTLDTHLDRVSDPELLKKAYDLDDRSTARKMYNAYYKELTGNDLELEVPADEE